MIASCEIRANITPDMDRGLGTAVGVLGGNIQGLHKADSWILRHLRPNLGFSWLALTANILKEIASV